MCSSGLSATAVTRSRLFVIRDKPWRPRPSGITAEEAMNLGAQLPMLLRGCYYEGWKPSRNPATNRTTAQFLARVAREFRGDPHNYEEIVAAVFSTLEKHITPGEIADVKANLPAELRTLWPAT